MGLALLDEGRIQIGALLYPRLVDRDNFYVLTRAFLLPTSADEFRRRVGQ